MKSFLRDRAVRPFLFSKREPENFTAELSEADYEQLTPEQIKLISGARVEGIDPIDGTTCYINTYRIPGGFCGGDDASSDEA